MDLATSPYTDMADHYLPATSPHPVLRLRRKGDRFEMTKKQPAKDGDASLQIEQTIVLSPEEYDALQALPSKAVSKRRYQYSYHGQAMEIDVFTGQLADLVLADIKFDNDRAKASYQKPDFCLAEVTQQTFLAGGMLCGKSYDDIRDQLEQLGYQPIDISRLFSQ